MNILGKYIDYLAYHCDDCGSTFIARLNPNTNKCKFCGSRNIDLSGNKRVCSHCGKLMSDGYIFYDGEAYYCSDECLRQHFSEEEYIQAFNEDDAYWTEW